METVLFEVVYEKAREAGLKAGKEVTPTPVVWAEAESIVGNEIVPGTESVVEEGMCGFAWIIVKPGNSKFANWLKATDRASKDTYYGGVSIWVGDFNQSHERKAAYARAFAKALRKLMPELKILAMDRLD